MIRNLGQVAAIYIGSSQPTNTNLIWLDNTVVPYAFRAYDGSTWSELATRDWVKMFVDGWLVSLPPSTQAGDTDYLLINSNNVNYKITVKEFVKSAVGNPLDFKGVIRTDADFPNPANCEAGDMYVIITSPAGGTVTDPYSGQVFEDTEKIVWDEVTKSWASLGKIEINVDLSTDYSATNVTINSSAGKSTTIEAASTSLAGVMLPQQVKRLTYLSNGSTVPGDPSELDPDTPAHKHNYGDILDRLISQQETGDSTFHPMSQKATTDNLDLKFDKANVVQVQGASTVMVMSQKAVTDAITTLDEWIKNELTKYLPLSGGDMYGALVMNNNVGVNAKNTLGNTYNLAVLDSNNQVQLGTTSYSTRINSSASDLIHQRSSTQYKIWDGFNLSAPISYGTLNQPTTAYDRNLGVNGSQWTFLSATNATTTSIFAPTTVGTSGQILQSSGTGAPVWANVSTVMDGYLPLSGGDMTGDITLGNSVYILGDNTSGRSLRIAGVNANNQVVIGSLEAPTYILSNSSDLIHSRNNVSYKILDSYNLPDPATLSGDNTWTGTNTFNGITNINNSFVLANSKALQGRNVAGTLNYAIGQVNANNNVEVGDTRVPLMLVSNDSNLIHYRGTTSYGIWDAYNLPDPAAKSADNVFTGTNSFTAGKFNVGAFEVTSIGKLLINMTNTGGWEGSLCWMNNGVDDSRIMFGAYGNADVAEFAWIGVGDVQYNTAQYRFYGTSMRVPSVWSLDDAGGNSLVSAQSTQLAHFGRVIGTTKIRSGNVDLIHTKGTADYKILDESNWESIIPNTKWTYGFVGMQVGSANQDLNTILNGDNNIKAVLNYYQVGALTNAPTGMSYGSVFQLYTNAFTSYGSEVLKPQLAFDVNHNVAGSTRYMYFRTPNNLGYGDSSNWKRVVTADENVATFSFDDDNYPTLKYIDGNILSWLRAPQLGFVPNTQATLSAGGVGSVGTTNWAFKTIVSDGFYGNKYFFGNTGMHLEGDADGVYFGASSSSLTKLLTSADLDLSKYLPLSGGDMTGDITLGNSVYILGDNTSGRSLRIAGVNANNQVVIGSLEAPTYILSNSSDLIHQRSSTQYKIWDGFNLSAPISYGTLNQPTTAYDRNLGVNGSQWTFLSATNATTTSIFAPTTVGTSGQILQSSGTGAPVWANVSTVMDGYLPLSGGIMTGAIQLRTQKIMAWARGQVNQTILESDGNNSYLGMGAGITYIKSGSYDLYHDTGMASYKIWDENNLQFPVISTSTRRVSDIQVVDTLPTTQVNGVLYLVVG